MELKWGGGEGRRPYVMVGEGGGGGGEGLCSFSDKGGEEEDFLMSC